MADKELRKWAKKAHKLMVAAAMEIALLKARCDRLENPGGVQPQNGPDPVPPPPPPPPPPPGDTGGEPGDP